MSCPTCGDWGTVKLQHGGGITDPRASFTLPCPACRPVEHQAARGGEQGDTAEELELHRLRRENAELRADLAALRGGKAP